MLEYIGTKLQIQPFWFNFDRDLKQIYEKQRFDQNLDLAIYRVQQSPKYTEASDPQAFGNTFGKRIWKHIWKTQLENAFGKRF